MTLAYDDGIARLLVGDVLDQLAALTDESVHCVVTSPPYWGLRDYGTARWEGGDPSCAHVAQGATRTPWANSRPGPAGATGKNAYSRIETKEVGGICACGARRVDRQHGLEPTPDEYIATMVEVFREIRRVLRKDGTLWLNMGDCYASSVNGTKHGDTRSGFNARYFGKDYAEGRQAGAAAARPDGRTSRDKPFSGVAGGLKPKDLVGMPWRLALALQADGWWLRRDIIWSKNNPMPESVTDRPTASHEYVFLLAKAERYFYDAEAVREASVSNVPGDLDGGPQRLPDGSNANDGRNYRSKKPDGWDTGLGGHGSMHRNGHEKGAPSEIRTGRNLRSVWTIPTQPYREAHFATFPEELPRRCILAGTSAKGCCPECGAPWDRTTSSAYVKSPVHGTGSVVGRHAATGANGYDGAKMPRMDKVVTTTGWRPTCSHDADPVPCTVLDPFAGSGTTLAVAKALDRRSIGIELSPEYANLAAKRIGKATAQMTIAETA